MAGKSGQRFEIPKKSSLVAELFTTQGQRDDDKREKVQDIPLSELDAFPNHPFQVKMDEAMQAMADSVKAVGIPRGQLSPTLEYTSEDGYCGIITLDLASVKCEAEGHKTSSYTVSATREYPHLSSNDLSLIPKTITDNGRTLELDSQVYGKSFKKCSHRVHHDSRV